MDTVSRRWVSGPVGPTQPKSNNKRPKANKVRARMQIPRDIQDTSQLPMRNAPTNIGTWYFSKRVFLSNTSKPKLNMLNSRKGALFQPMSDSIPSSPHNRSMNGTNLGRRCLSPDSIPNITSNRNANARFPMTRLMKNPRFKAKAFANASNKMNPMISPIHYTRWCLGSLSNNVVLYNT